MKHLPAILVILLALIAVFFAWCPCRHVTPPSNLEPLIRRGDSIQHQVRIQDSIRALRDTALAKADRIRAKAEIGRNNAVRAWMPVRSDAERFIRDSLGRARASAVDSMLVKVMRSDGQVIAADSSEILASRSQIVAARAKSTADTTEIASLKRLHRNDSTLQGAYAGQLKCARDSLRRLARKLKIARIVGNVKFGLGVMTGAAVTTEIKR